jgi:hypothetical protein
VHEFWTYVQESPVDLVTMTLRIVHQPHLLSEFDMHPHQTMDEHAHYHFYSPLEISASKFLAMLGGYQDNAARSSTGPHSLLEMTADVVLPGGLQRAIVECIYA